MADLQVFKLFFYAITLHLLARVLNLLGFKVRAFQIMLKSNKIADNLIKEIF